MKKLTNCETITSFLELLPKLQKEFETINEAMKEYYEYLNEEQYQEKQNETDEEKLTRLENTLNRIPEIVEKRTTLKQSASGMISMMKTVSKQFEEITGGEEDQAVVGDATNEIVESIMNLRQKMLDDLISPMQKQIEEAKRKYAMEMERLQRNKKEGTIEMKQRIKKEKEIVEEKAKMEDFNLSNEECDLIEEWTKKSIDSVVFDTKKDNWNKNTCTFNDKITNRGQMVFLVEDTENSKFGGYVEMNVGDANDHRDRIVNDSNAFVFSLKLHGKSTGKRFNLRMNDQPFAMRTSSNDTMFIFGNGCDIRVCKFGVLGSYCSQSSYDYKGMMNVLCGQRNFLPKRVVVIQMK